MLSVVEICRHGARAPIVLFPFNEKLWKKQELGFLTDVGARQQYELGQRLRQRYVCELKLLPEKYNRKDIKTVATSRGRTRLSALYQLMGMYPPLRISQLLNTGSGGQSASTRSSNEVPPIERMMGREVEHGYRIVKDDKLLKGYTVIEDPEMVLLNERAKKTTQFVDREANWRKTLFPQVSQILNIPVDSIVSASEISSTLECDVSNKYPLPPGITPSLFTSLQAVHAFKKFEVPFAIEEARVRGFSNLFSDIQAGFELAQKGSGQKFKLYSAHDTTISGVLRSFGYTLERVPEFASCILLELHADLTVHCFFNQQPVKGNLLAFPCTLQDFQAALRPFTDFEKARNR